MTFYFLNWRMRVFQIINPEDDHEAVWICGIWDEKEQKLYQGDLIDTKNKALVEGLEILASWYLPCDYGCADSEEADCKNCEKRHNFDEFEKKVKEAMEK